MEIVFTDVPDRMQLGKQSTPVIFRIRVWLKRYLVKEAHERDTEVTKKATAESSHHSSH